MVDDLSVSPTIYTSRPSLPDRRCPTNSNPTGAESLSGVARRGTGAGVIQFSPANTSAIFTTSDDDGRCFRTAPCDLLERRAFPGVR